MTEPTLHWPERVRTLPMTLDRFRAASVFFDVKFPPFLAGHLDAQKWISWGSLSAVASIPEVFAREVQFLGFATEWRSSPERNAMRNDQFLATLKELRNYETHLTFLTRRRTSEIPRDQIISHVDFRSFFFGPISFSQLSELRNIREGRSPVTQAAVDAFNRLAETHTVEAIIVLGLDRLSEIIATFLSSIGYASPVTTVA
ncbi:MAG: hypothetical protein WCF18_07520 [Chthoniobacteraceae bacterium]